MDTDFNAPMSDSTASWLASLPKLAPATPTATGFLPAMGSALKSGLYGQIAAPLAQTVQGIGALTGLPKLQEFGAAGARGWEQQAQAAATPELEQQGWFGSPKSFAYHLAQAIPSTAAMIGGAALGPETAIPRIGEMIGAGVAAFPSMFGSNIQNEEASGPLTQGGAARAAGLAVPESAAMGLMPSSLEKFAKSGLDGNIVKRMFTAGGAAAAQQAGAQAGITATTDAVYNPEMPADERARRIVFAALSGGAMGLVFGGAFGAVRRATPHLDTSAPTPAIDDATKTILEPAQPTTPTPEATAPVAPTPEATAPTPPMSTAEAGLAEAQKPVPPPDAAAAFMDKTLAGMNKRSADKIRTDPFFANVADEPALINAIKARAEVYDKADKDLPKGLQTLVDKFGTDTEAAEHVKRAGDLAAVANTLPEAAKALPEAQQLAAWHVEAATRRANAITPPGVTPAPMTAAPAVDDTKTIPYLAGSSTDGKTVYIDPAVPKTMTVKGVTFDPKPFLTIHESVEHDQMVEKGSPYQTAHRVALEAEQAAVEKAGIDWKGYQEQMGKLAAETQREKATTVPPDLYEPPGEAQLLQKEGDHAFVQERGATPVGAGEPSGVGGGVGPGDAARAVAGARPDVAGAAEAAQANGNEQAGAGGARTAAQAGLKPNLKMAPEWANAAAAQDHGEVVFAHPDGDHAVTRSFDAWGDPQYQMVSRTGAIPDPAKINELKQAITQDKLQDKLEAQKRPDGPWTGKTDAVVGTRSVDPSDVGLVAGWLRQIGMGATKVALVHPQDARGDVATQEGLNGPYQAARFAGSVDNAGEFAGQGGMQAFGSKQNQFWISTGPNLSQAAKADTLGHEVGHVVKLTALRNAPATTQKAVVDAHAQYLSKTQGVPLQDVIKMTRLRSNTDDVSHLTTDQQSTFRNYVTSFSEWFADNVSRELTSAQEPTSVIEKFFYGVAQKMRQLMQTISGDQFLPDPAVAKFMSDLRANATPQMWSNDLSRGRMGDKIPVGEPAHMKLGIPDRKDVPDAINMVQEEVGNRIKAAGVDASGKWSKALDYMTTFGDLANSLSKVIPAAKDWYANHEMKNATTKALVKGLQMSMQPYNDASRPIRDLADKIGIATQRLAGANPFKTWADQPDLHALPNADKIEAAHRAVQSDISRLTQMKGLPALGGLFQTGRALGLQEVAAQIHNVMRIENEAGRPVPGYDYSSLHEAFRTNNPAQDNPALMVAHFQTGVDGRMAAIKSYLDNATGEISKFANVDPTKAATMRGDIDGIQGLYNNMKTRLDQIAPGTYIPLDHGHGSVYIRANMATDENGIVKPEAQAALQAMLDKGGYNVGVNQLSGNNRFFIRVAKDSIADRLNTGLKALQDQGHILPGIETGRMDAPKASQFNVKFIDAQIASIWKSVEPLADKNVASAIATQQISRLMDMFPDSSMKHVLEKRDLTSGYTNSAGQAMTIRAQNSARNSTEISMRGDTAAAMAALHAQASDVGKNSALSASQKLNAQGSVNELMLREAQRAWQVPRSIFDTFAGFMHSLVIGSNIAYPILPMSQQITLLYPTLAEKFGHAAGAAAVFNAQPETMRVVAAVMKGQNGWTFDVRQMDLLAATNISKTTIDAVMRAENAGKLTSYTKYMETSEPGASPGEVSLMDKANALGLHSEMWPRIATIIAASRLADAHPEKLGGMSKDDYVDHVLDKSMMSWGPGETSRMTGNKGGIMGPFTKISMAFVQWQSRMLQTYYHSLEDIMGHSGAQAQKEARTFLLSHMAASVVLSGTLGLPFASAAAGAFDKLAKEWTGRDDIDVAGQYRAWLKNTFGPVVGDMIAKGAPRGAGIDLSKLGDANLLPGTSILTDKRKFEDAEKDWFKSMAGAGTSTAGNIIMGMRDVTNGDYLNGMIKMMPETIKGMFEAYRLTDRGYVNNRGEKLPMQPSALDVLKTALGFTPTSEAANMEQARTFQGEHAMREEKEQNISRHLVQAMNLHDPEAFQRWMQEGNLYMQQHPGMGSPLQSFQQELQKSLKEAAMSQATGQPLGEGIFDPARFSTDFLPTMQ